MESKQYIHEGQRKEKNCANATCFSLLGKIQNVDKKEQERQGKMVTVLPGLVCGCLTPPCSYQQA